MCLPASVNLHKTPNCINSTRDHIKIEKKWVSRVQFRQSETNRNSKSYVNNTFRNFRGRKIFKGLLKDNLVKALLESPGLRILLNGTKEVK